MKNLIKYKAVPFSISGIIFLISLVLLGTIGLNPSIDFTGGSLMEITFSESRPEPTQIIEIVQSTGIENPVVQSTNEDGYIIKTPFLSEEEHQNLLVTLRTSFETGEEVTDDSAQNEFSGTVNENGEVVLTPKAPTTRKTTGNYITESRFETIGPAISSYLKDRAWQAAIVVILAIIAFVAYAFRKVSRPVNSWKFGVTAIIALIHDITITMGIFVLLGKYLGVEVGIPFVVALLTILGYSVNDTIVVFDRIREKIIKRGSEKFDETVSQGVGETLVRSFNTSFTTLLVLFALFFFGGESIKYFALALIVGIALGTYSSIFLASPLLVMWERYSKR